LNNSPAIGFIGFGEAGFNIANGLRGSGIDRIFAFDIRTDSEDFGPKIRERAGQSRAQLVDSSEQLASSSEILFSTVTASSALEAADQTAPFLRPHHIYADLNSISPGLKQEIDRTVRSTGARFVEAAVMAPVPPYGHQVPMLLGGNGAEAFASTLRPFGMRFEVVSGGVGTAVAVKMCRSIIVKGMEALIFECVMGASRYGAEDRVFASLKESFPGIDWKKLADYMVGRVVVHGERRAREMEEVAATLRAMGVDPIMAEATARRQDWSAAMDLRSRFGPDGPSGYKEVLEVLQRAMDEPGA
jgi:3-hydroxyisobutyrate dehydrogenase-like beta-hydroxyacid dehydrogenase